MLSVSGHRVRASVAGLLLGLAAAGVAQVHERIWARYEAEMQDPVDDPPDAGRKGEVAFGRLRYPSPLDGRRFGGYARWGIDANKGDRLFISILRRLTRIDVEPTETIVEAGSDQMFDIPFLFAVSVGDWSLTPDQAKRIGEYLKRGGFLMVDDFHNEREWSTFMEGIKQMGLDSEPEDLLDSSSAFHVVFNLKERIRVPGANVVHSSGIERGGTIPHWRGIMDSRGRMMVAITFNQDMGDGWEFADIPDYPEQFSSQAIRLGTNYVVYAMTH